MFLDFDSSDLFFLEGGVEFQEIDWNGEVDLEKGIDEFSLNIIETYVNKQFWGIQID